MATINEQNLDAFAQQIENAYLDIPFGLSRFEIENFSINQQLTAERAHRSIGVRMTELIRVIRLTQFARRRNQVDLDELATIINDQSLNQFVRARARIDIDEKEFEMIQFDKTVTDALAELNILFEHFERLPEFDREDFEAGEPIYHNETINRQLRGIVGATASAENAKRKNPALERKKDNGNPNPNSIR